MATELGIRIKTTFDNKGVDAAKKSFAGFKSKGSDAANTAKKSFAGFNDGIKNTGKDLVNQLGPAALAGPAAAIGALVIGMGSLAASSLKAAEVSRSVSSAFRSLSGGAEIATANLAAMRKATGGLISETEQMQIANQLLGMQIVQTADQLEEVVGVSRRLGQEFKGLGARDAAEEFAIMIANMSVARLDSFGLSSGRVRKRINELMEETKGMTREAAFFQATMEEGQATIERLGPEIATTANESARLSSEWKNLKVVMGAAIEETGVAKNFFRQLSDAVIQVSSLLGDDSAETSIKSLTATIKLEEKSLERLKKAVEEDFLGGRFKSSVKSTEIALARMRAELILLTRAQDATIESGKRQQETLQAAIRSEELAAESLAKREAAEVKLLDTQKKFAKELITIQADTVNQLSDSQETFDKDRLKNAQNNLDKLDDIREKARKADVRADAKLSKDKARINTNLGKALIKNQLNENKKIDKAKADFTKQDKTERRKRRIDATGDERLFQLDLRNLAADGEGIAIKEALERRAIEQQIASEKAEFEKEVEQDKRKDQISSIKAEGTDRRSELRQQAEERKADLQERSSEAAVLRNERITEDILKENESFAQKQADLNEALIVRNEAIREAEADRIQEIAKGLAEGEELAEGSFDRLIALANEFGPEFGQSFADGMAKGFEENLKIESLIKSTKDLIGASVSRRSSSLGAGGGAGSGGPTRIGGIQEFQGGGILNSDGVFFGHQGEEIANPNEGQAITIGDETFAVREAGRLASAINSMRQRDMQELVDVVAASL